MSSLIVEISKIQQVLPHPNCTLHFPPLLSSSGLGYWSFNPETRVRFPLRAMGGTLNDDR
jgi:hypothetical protein